MDSNFELSDFESLCGDSDCSQDIFSLDEDLEEKEEKEEIIDEKVVIKNSIIEKIEPKNYRGFTLVNPRMISKVDNFWKKIEEGKGIVINSDKNQTDTISKPIDLSESECLDILEILYYKEKFWQEYRNKNKHEIVEGWEKILKNTLIKLFRITLDEFERTIGIENKILVIFRISEYLVKYYKIVKELFNSEKFYYVLISKQFELIKEEGLISCFLTFAKYWPEMVSEECYPEISKTGIGYRKSVEIFDNIQEDNVLYGLFQVNRKYFL